MASVATAGAEAARIPTLLKAPAMIETARLLLRRPLTSDAHAVFARYAGNAAVTRYLGWRTHGSVADTQLFLACCEAEWLHAGVGPYLVQSRETGLLLGSTGLRPSSSQQAATGYVLAQDAWGRGYATETLLAMRGLALRMGILRLTAICHPEHHASARVIRSAGSPAKARCGPRAVPESQAPGSSPTCCVIRSCSRRVAARS